jgi:hypothetical protein
VTDGMIRLANEFTEVVVERVQTRNGARLRISVPSSGHQILLCPLELEALTWQDHELFSRLLRTPHGPEDGSPEALSSETLSSETLSSEALLSEALSPEEEG